MPEPDLNFVLSRLDAMQREFHETLRTLQLRDDQREASHQALMRTLTSQMVAVGTQVDERLAALEARMDERLGRIETVLADIARKLDA